MRKVLVAGSSGYLGSRIVKEALRRGWKVVGLSRKNKNETISHPNFSHLSIDLSDKSSLSMTSSPSSNDIRSQIEGACAAVHSIGTLFEDQSYKVLKGGSLCEFVNRSIISGKSLLLQQPDKTAFSIRNNSRSNIMTLNRDTALNFYEICDAALGDTMKKFCFVSTASQLIPFPFQELFLDKRYWESKNQVENALLSATSSIARDKIIVRPGFMYSDAAPVTLPISTVMSLMNIFKKEILPRNLSQMLPPPPARPLHVDTVARFIVDQIESPLRSSSPTPEPRIFDTEDMYRHSFSLSGQ